MGIDYSEILTKLRGTMGAFVYGIFTKWYILVAGAAIAVTYNLFSALSKEGGVFATIYNTLDQVFRTTLQKSIECPSLIADFSDFMNCLGR